MSYPHKFGPMYDDSSFMISFLSCMINVDHGLHHDPYHGESKSDLGILGDRWRWGSLLLHLGFKD